MLLPCVLYTLTTGLHLASCVTSLPSPSEKSRGSTSRPNGVEGKRGVGEQLRGDGRLGLHDTRGQPWHSLRDELPAQAVLLPTGPSVDKAIPSTKEASVFPSDTPTVVTLQTPILHPIDSTNHGPAASIVTTSPSLGLQVRGGALSNATTTPSPSTTSWKMTTVYIGTDGSTVTPKPTSTALPSASQRSNAQERAGIASGTVGAVLVVALLTLFCYRRSRRRVREKQGFMSISDSNSVSEAAERGDLVGQGDLFGSSETSIPSYIAVETITTNKPQIPEPAHGGTAQKDPTFERIPIYFQPSRGTVRRYPGLPSTPRPSIWRPSIRRPDYLNPVVREPALVPLPLRPGRRTPARSRSVPVWTGLRNPAREPSTVEPGAARHQVRAGGRAKSMTSSVYSSSFVGSATVGDRTSRAATTARVTSGATDATGLRSTIAEFPRPPPHTFSRSDGPGMSTTWRESFNFSALEDEVLLAFPHLARDMEGQPV